MKQYPLILLLISATLFVACTSISNPLKHEDAKQQIVRYYEAKPPKELMGNIVFEAVIRGKDSGNNGTLFRLYTAADLIRLKEIRAKEQSDSIYIFEITEKGKPYIIKDTLSNKGYPMFVVKTYDYYISDITEIKYSPDKKESAAFFNLAARHFTPFGEKVVDPNHKIPLIALFRLDENNDWKFQRVEINVDEVWPL